MKSYFEIDREKKHKIKCIEVPFITKTQIQPNLKKVYNLFPSVPCSCLRHPNMEVGLLLGQNANILLPTGGNGEYRVNNLRVWRTLLRETGYVLEGHTLTFESLKRKLNTSSSKGS